MTKEERKEYMKAYYQANKEDYKAYYQAHKEQRKTAAKAYRQAHKEDYKAYYQTHKEKMKAQKKAWCEANKDKIKEYMKSWQADNKDKCIAYMKADVNSFGETKNSIRKKSQRILKKSGIKIPGYQIHHCFTYDDPTKFIYCSKEMHLKIHQFLRDNHIDADSDHYEQIKQLLDEKVITFGL